MTGETSPHYHMTRIEDRAANMDIGRMGFQIIQGAIEEGATKVEAFQILSSYYAGMFISAAELNKKKEEDEETPSS